MNERFEIELPGFQSYFCDENSEKLIGQGIIYPYDKRDKKLSIKIPDEHQIYLSDVKITFYNDFEGKRSHFFMKILNGEIEFSNIDLSVTPEQFCKLHNENKNVVITIMVDFPETRILNKDYFDCKLIVRSLSYQEQIYNPVPPMNWKDINHITREWFIHNSGDSQLEKICWELIQNLETWVSINYSKHMQGYFSDINELIGDLRASFAWSPVNNNDEWLDFLRFYENNQFDGTGRTVASLFLKRIEDEPNELQKKLKWKYDNIWSTGRQKAIECIKNNRVITDIFKNNIIDYPYLATESLDEIASYYINRPWMQSSHLEWILIDALIFNESSNFAVQILDLEPKKVSHKVFKATLKSVDFLLTEGFYLFVTAFVSNIIDDQHQYVFWIVFSTITLIRWLKTSTSVKATRLENIKQLARDMMTVSDKSRNLGFNPRLLRDLLYDLEKRGAVYSPWIFNLLDKRILRES
jgi:hypothetical protein